jgi:hypothetical protein
MTAIPHLSHDLDFVRTGANITSELHEEKLASFPLYSIRLIFTAMGMKLKDKEKHRLPRSA